MQLLDSVRSIRDATSTGTNNFPRRQLGPSTLTWTFFQLSDGHWHGQFQLQLPGTETRADPQPKYPLTPPADTPGLPAEVPEVGENHRISKAGKVL